MNYNQHPPHPRTLNYLTQLYYNMAVHPIEFRHFTEEMKELQKYETQTIFSIYGFSPEDYVTDMAAAAFPEESMATFVAVWRAREIMTLAPRSLKDPVGHVKSSFKRSCLISRRSPRDGA